MCFPACVLQLIQLRTKAPTRDAKVTKPCCADESFAIETVSPHVLLCGQGLMTLNEAPI